MNFSTDHLDTLVKDLTTVSPEVREAIRACIKDAERYRWLRNQASFGTRHDPVACLYPGTEDWECLEGEALDTAIDLVSQEGSKG